MKSSGHTSISFAHDFGDFDPLPLAFCLGGRDAVTCKNREAVSWTERPCGRRCVVRVSRTDSAPGVGTAPGDSRVASLPLSLSRRDPPSGQGLCVWGGECRWPGVGVFSEGKRILERKGLIVSTRLGPWWSQFKPKQERLWVWLFSTDISALGRCSLDHPQRQPWFSPNLASSYSSQFKGAEEYVLLKRVCENINAFL